MIEPSTTQEIELENDEEDLIFYEVKDGKIQFSTEDEDDLTTFNFYG